ncbi:MAG TPA: DUF1552 domain-containing protein, partial [Bryobacteraceae bacterium]|nr:DUF1552 domain-containing protein [Bryobacteraceae bacterium]
MPGKSLPRRTLLKGMGTAIALPLLDSMVPAFTRAAATKAPCRMAMLYVPNGIVMNQWMTDLHEGVSPLPAEFPRVSAAFKPFRDDLMFLGGLTQNGGRALGDGPGDHGRAGANYLTCVHPKKTNGRDLETGISVDQIAARRLEGKTRFASLELGCEEGVQGGSCDNGYSCAYSNSISWRTPSSPMPPEIRPRAVFERMFGAADEDPREARYRKSILDLVSADAQRLNMRLGGADKRKLDEYLFSIRDLEKRIETAEKQSSRAVKPSMAAPPSSIPAEFSEHARIMFDLTTLAFRTDTTRIVTLLLALEQSPRAYPEIGIPEAHHGLTHHQGDKEKIEKVTQINCFHAKQFAYLLEKLRSTPDGDGTLLDHSMITYGSGLSDGNAHDHANLPMVLAGRACGRLKPGRYVGYPKETPMANLYVAMLD